jgi:SAM-dependent methyltransferase
MADEPEDGPEDGAEFRDPVLYDVENRWGLDDDFYLDLARRMGGPVLDLGCGTGRLARAVAKAGIPVTGVDGSTAMLDRARSLSGSLPVEWVEADCRALDLGRRFRLALMTGHAFQLLLTEADQDALLERVAAHLERGGRFAFETRNPAVREAGEARGARPWRSYQDLLGRWIDVSVLSRWDPGTRIERLAVTRTRRDTGEAERSRIDLRYTTAAELNTLLVRHGFTVEAQHGDWIEGPVTDDSPEIVTLCRTPD